jgi:hypothetical protein
MVYQISEKNQILIALFAIVVLCAGKLFKDYLFRRGYIEGLTVIPVADKPLRRNPNQDVTGITFTLNTTLGADLGSNGVITVRWPTGKEIRPSSNLSDYTVMGITTNDMSLITSSNPATLRFTNGGSTLSRNTRIQINMANVSITRGNEAINDFSFTTTAGSEPAVLSQVQVLAPSTGAGSNSGLEGTSITEIRAALDSINSRLNETPAPEGAEKANLLKAQNALVNVLAYTYGTIKEAGKVFDSGELYEAQKTAMEFIEREKKRASKNANLLKQDNLNKRRMAQINTYYTRNYEANTEVMKNIIFVTIALIVLAVLRNKDLIPASIATLGVIFVLTLGGIVIGTQVFDIIRRNDHDFDKYDWNFNEDELNRKQLLQQNSDPANLSEMGMGLAPCYGPGCCNIGTKWDETDKKCVPVGSATFVSGTLSVNINIKAPLVSGDKITLTLPSGFTLSNGAISGASGTGTPKTDGPFDVIPGAKSANTIHTITITGLSYGSGTDKTVKVTTTKEPTQGSIYIVGI